MQQANEGEPAGKAERRSHEERWPPWLLGQKIAVPCRVDGYLDRAALIEHAMPTRRRLTVLRAPGGFGKTTVLAECCRRLQEAGVPAAWVLVDERDEPAVLDTYVACAVRRAAAGASPQRDTRTMPQAPEPRGAQASRTALAMRELAARNGPFVLVLDELERVVHPESAALIDDLLERGPPNLHLAFACRELPAGVNVAGAVLERRAAILSDDDLRFSRAEVARFFKGKLTRARLGALMAQSAGWPFALTISRNEMAGGARTGARAARQFVENWVESRLFAGLGAEEREFLLDLGLFEWMDAALLDDVLERTDSRLRIETMAVLAGMLEPVRDGATDVWRLHPLIREHCVRSRFRETPQRYRSVHRRIAEALARRGQTAAALRHAVEAGEPALAGDMLERAGGVRLQALEGAVEFQAAATQLSRTVVEERPRLALVRCLSLLLSGQPEQARERFRSLAQILAGVAADESEGSLDFRVERCMVRGMIALYGGGPFDRAFMEPHLVDISALAASPRIDHVTRGIMEYSLSVAGNVMAHFEAAIDHGARARRYFAQNRHMSVFIDLQEGQVAMAQGRVRDAAALYRRAERIARASYLLGPEPAAICTVLSQELALECASDAPRAELVRVPDVLVTGASPFQAYSAASTAVVELTLHDEGVERALVVTGEMLEYVHRARLPALVRQLAALKVSLLAGAGRAGDAERAWAAYELPEHATDCLDLSGQSWREMEAIACARLRLAIAHERFDEGRGFAETLRAKTAARGLRRTLMRALALCAALEVRAGEEAAARALLEDYLRLYTETPYAGALVRERAHCAHLVGAIVESGADASCPEAAQALLGVMARADDPRRTVLNLRERQVLERLSGQRDKQIAAELGLSPHGVRYHLRNLFAKLGARNRAEAVRRARQMGLITIDY